MNGSTIPGQGTTTGEWLFSAGGSRTGWGAAPGVLPPLGLPGDPAWGEPTPFPGLAEAVLAALRIDPPRPLPLPLPELGTWPTPLPWPPAAEPPPPPPLLPEADWTPTPDQLLPGQPQPPADSNQAPLLLGGERKEVEIPEGTDLPARLLAAFDPEGDFITWRVEGGADADLLRLDAGSGELAFRFAPDFERPRDADGDNRYEVVVRVDDIWGGTDTQTVIIRVTDRTDSTPGLPTPPGEHLPEPPLPPVDLDMRLSRGDAFAIGAPIPQDQIWM